MIGKVIVGGLLAKLIYELLPKEAATIKNDKIFVDFLVEEPKQNIGVLKSMMTRRVNKIINGVRSFKIGKTGNPDGRITKYSEYAAMYLLCRSTNKELIDELEGYLNDKYCGMPGCDNDKGGSAGSMTQKYDEYFLYVVVQ